MNEIDPQKLELLRQALPRGLSAGDGGLVDVRGTPDVMPQFEPFRSNTTQQKLRNPTPEFTDIPQVGSGGSPVSRQPWDIIATQNPNKSYTLSVIPGTINGVLPQNWNSSFTATENGVFYGKATISTDSREITGVSISINTTPPNPQSSEKFAIESNIEYLFGIFFSGTSYRVTNNFSLSPKQWIVVSADPPAQPGESPFDIYYRLT